MSTLHISSRSRALLERGSTNPLLHALIRTFSSQYSATNELGVVNAGLAENSLMHDWLTAFFEKNLKLASTDFTYGTSLVGSTRLFAALTSFYPDHFHPRTPLQPAHIVCANGVTSVIDNLAAVLCDPGEAILVPTPYYNSFPDDFIGRAGVILVEGILQEGYEGTEREIEALERAMVEGENAASAKVRAVLVTNPHNPLGFCYSKEMLEAYCRFAEKWDVYLISDEIYATSVYKSDVSPATPFTSILSLDPSSLGCNPARVIQLYGMSKDFGANGFRIGVLVAQQNSLLVSALSSLGMTMKIGSPADALWSALLTSPSLPSYIALNQQRLAEAYTFVTTWLRSHSIPYRPANAGHFVLIDCRKFLPLAESDLASELALLNGFVEAGVYLGPGFSYAVKTNGFFRLTFSIQREYLLVGLRRIEKVLGLVSTGLLLETQSSTSL